MLLEMKWKLSAVLIVDCTSDTIYHESNNMKCIQKCNCSRLKRNFITDYQLINKGWFSITSTNIVERGWKIDILEDRTQNGTTIRWTVNT